MVCFRGCKSLPTLHHCKNPAWKHIYIVWGDPAQISQVKSGEKKTNQNDDKHVMAKVTTCFQQTNVKNPALVIFTCIHHPSSIIHHPSSIIHHPSSIIHHPSSIIHHPSSIIHHPSSIIHHPSSIIIIIIIVPASKQPKQESNTDVILMCCFFFWPTCGGRLICSDLLKLHTATAQTTSAVWGAQGK